LDYGISVSDKEEWRKMIERYLRHKKWTSELQKNLRQESIAEWLLDWLCKMGVSRVFIIVDAKNNKSYQILKNALEKSELLSINYIRKLEDVNFDNLTQADIVIADDKYKNHAFESGISFLTLFDIYNILQNKQYFNAEIPRIVNSIENGYKSIAVAGEGEFAERIKEYLSSNESIIEIKADQLTKCSERGRKYYYYGKEKVDIVIVADLRVTGNIVDQEGNSLSTFFLLNLASSSNNFISNSSDDIAKNIVPYLNENGVKVVWCQSPIKDVFPKKVEKKIKRDSRIRSLAPRVYSRIRKRELEKENLGYMYGLGKHTKIDCSKGYRECFGNVEHLNYDNGFRRTVGNDSISTKNIWVFGPCMVDPNARVDDRKTIPSLLKEKVGTGYNVHNRGGSFGGMSLLIRNTRFKEGDIVIIFSSGKEKNDSATINYDLTKSYQQIEELEKHVNDNLLHCDSSVINQIANDIYDRLLEEDLLNYNILDGAECVCLGKEIRRIPSIHMLEEGPFKKYLKELRTKKIKGKDDVKGAIVMNCNPFTFGHRYLIETASQQVDILYIFVVEEDKSYFPFEDRFELVRQGTADIGNVIVIPSGNYIISSQTLAGYFEKETIGKIYLDATMDLELFAQIAQELGITKRFAGEEPIDEFTRQYNRNMQEILESFGIEFVEIARKEMQGAPISASRVRALLKEQDFQTIKELVPASTYDYLKNRFR